MVFKGSLKAAPGPAFRPGAALLACLLAASCHSKTEEEKPEPVSVRVATVDRGPVARNIEAAGPLEPPPGMDVKLGTLIAGRLSEVFVAEGDAVKSGQLLARLDPRPLRDAVSQAEAQASQARAQEENARVRLGRSEKAFAAGLAAGQEVDDGKLQLATASAAVRTANAALSTTRNQLSRSELRAPFAGLVAHLFVPAGEPVDANKPVVEIARTNVLELHAPLAPRLAVAVRAGQSAEVRVDGLEGQTFPGRVVAVAPVIDPQTGTALARIRVDNKSGALKGGSFARAIIQADVHQNVLRVPREALLSGDSATSGAVEIVDKDGKARRQPIELGYQDGKLLEVTSGLAGGERVVVQGAYALPDGTPLKVEGPDAEARDGGGGGGETAPKKTGETAPKKTDEKAGEKADEK